MSVETGRPPFSNLNDVSNALMDAGSALTQINNRLVVLCERFYGPEAAEEEENKKLEVISTQGFIATADAHSAVIAVKLCEIKNRLSQIESTCLKEVATKDMPGSIRPA